MALHPARTIIQPGQSVQPTAPLNTPPFALVVDEATTNLITNPSIEAATTGWTASGANASIARVTSQKKYGDASLEVTVSPAAASQGVTSAALSVDASQAYSLSVWIKGNAGGELVTVRVTGDVSGATNSNITLTSDWRRYVVRKTAGASDTTFTVLFITNTSQALVFYVDAIQLEKKSLPTSYCDGSLGLGYSWSGTAHASSSSRIAGSHTLAPITDGSVNPLVVGTDGALHFTNGIIRVDSATGIDDIYGLDVVGNQDAFVSLGTNSAIMRVYNAGDGAALWVKSDTTSQFALLVEGGSITSGTILGVFAPSDLSTMASSGGKFLDFADKSGASSYVFGVNAFKIGSSNLNYQHYFQGLGAGAYSSSSTAKTGTASSSGTTVTGTGTSFTTEFSVGDIIVASGQERLITAIASNTSLTTLTAFNPALSGASIARADDQYYPYLLCLEGPGGDHQNLDYVGRVSTLFMPNTTRLKLYRQQEASGTGTLTSSGTTVTGSGTAFTTQLSIGDIIVAGSQRRVVANIASNTSLTTRTAFNPTLSGASFTYVNTTVATPNPNIVTTRYDPVIATPTADTDGKYFVLEEFKDTASKTTTSNTSEQSIFTTTPTIKGGSMGATGTLEVKAFGTFGAAAATKTLTIRVKLGSTTILTTHAETVANTNAQNWDMDIVIQNTATNAQKTSLRFTSTQATSGSAVEVIQDYETATVDTTLDQALDISIQWGTTANTLTKESMIGKIW